VIGRHPAPRRRAGVPETRSVLRQRPGAGWEACHNPQSSLHEGGI